MKKINRKNGITLLSLVVYLILFFGFTVFVTNISGNINNQLFEQRGLAINITNVNKLQYNLFTSAKKSNAVLVKAAEVSFSNGDIYKYDSARKVVYKNGGILCSNVNSFVAVSSSADVGTKVDITTGYTKYLSTIERTFIVLVEDEI